MTDRVDFNAGSDAAGIRENDRGAVSVQRLGWMVLTIMPPSLQACG